MEKRFFGSMRIERMRRKVYRTREQARADGFNSIERVYNPTRRHSTPGYDGPVQFEQARKAPAVVHREGRSPDRPNPDNRNLVPREGSPRNA